MSIDQTAPYPPLSRVRSSLFTLDGSVTVVVCPEAEMANHVAAATAAAGHNMTGSSSGSEIPGPGPRSSGRGLFDVILLGGGGGATASVPAGVGGRGEEGGAERAGLSPAERLDIVLDR